jgi:5-methylcytosine-specific restriction endonuclease McrA
LNKKKDKNIERVRRAVPRGVARKLWIKSGGRCQYFSCNIPLWKDQLMQRDMNKAYISHIIAAKENGPRGEKGQSEALELDYSNLMLLCDECHNRIDKAQVSEHPKELLRQMKQKHEERIERVTGITEDKKSHIVTYSANIGMFEPKISFMDAAMAMRDFNYASSDNPIKLGLNRAVFKDDEDDFWQIQERQLDESFRDKVKPLLELKKNHFSVFGLAPQPLLIKLGVKFSEIANCEVYQLHREPKQTWEWPIKQTVSEVQLIEPADISKIAVLIISMSDEVNLDRIHSVLGNDISVWEITVDNPNRNIIKSRDTLINFKNTVRDAFSKIRMEHCGEAVIHLFPVMPNSCAIETGRVWMPKVDLPMIIYDQNKNRDGFYKTITIK